MQRPLRRGGIPFQVGGSPALGLAGRTERMTCPKCRSLLFHAECQTDDGAWFGWRCPTCGYVQDMVMLKHRMLRPEPFRQLPQKPTNRPIPIIGRKPDRRS